MSGHPTNLRVKLPLLCALLQLATVLLFAFFIQYDSHTSPRLWHEEMQLHNKGLLDNEFYPRYPSEYLPRRRCPPARMPGPTKEAPGSTGETRAQENAPLSKICGMAPLLPTVSQDPPPNAPCLLSRLLASVWFLDKIPSYSL